MKVKGGGAGEGSAAIGEETRRSWEIIIVKMHRTHA